MYGDFSKFEASKESGDMQELSGVNGGLYLDDTAVAAAAALAALATGHACLPSTSRSYTTKPFNPKILNPKTPKP